MLDWSIIVFWSLVGLLVGQGLLVLGFVGALRRFRKEPLADDACPRAATILCLRGGDPFLEDCISALFRLDYPNYDIHIVIDNDDDPAWKVVNQVLSREQRDRVHVTSLIDRRETCSLKCSSVLQAVSQLDEAVEFIAILDADTIPHASWLRELAGGLADEKVGVATGNRWYMPEKPTLGALIRYAWNAAAVVQMYSYKIPWGGSLAIKTHVLRETDVLDKWGNSFCEDTMMQRVLAPLKLKVNFVPSLMMINREGCDVKGYFGWVRRQLLTARLYHPGWPLVVGHGLLTSVGPLMALVLGIMGLAASDQQTAWWGLGGFALYEIVVMLMLPPMEFAVRDIVKFRGEPIDWLSPATFFQLLFAIPATAVVYTAALASACFVRAVNWRGISYDVGGPFKIRMLEYQPYEAADDAQEVAHASL